MSSKAMGAKWLVALVLVTAVSGCARFTGTKDLLRNIDPGVDAVNGRWRFEGRALLSEHTPQARIALPVIPYGDYRLRLEFARVIGDGSVNVILPADERQVLLVLDGGSLDEPASGLELIDGRTCRENATADRRFRLENHRRYVLEAVVRTRGSEATIDVNLDGLPFVRWTGRQDALALPSEWALDPPATLGFGSSDCVVEVFSATVRMIPGQTSWLPD